MEYKLIQGEIGKDDLSDFMNGLPHIDILYNAPPNPEMMNFWHKYQPRSYTYKEFFVELVKIYRIVDADVCYIESGTNYDMMIAALDYPVIRTLEIIYSAPGAKKKIPYKLIVASKKPANLDFTFKYSHELLDCVLGREHGINVFDPCIGKGQLLKYALKHGHNCYGIEFDPSRLAYALKMIKE